MTSPFRYRPENEDEDATDWDDNWVSNFMAWASVQLGMDQANWPARLTNWMWTDCATCLAWRGITVGFLCGLTVAAIA